MFSSRKFHLRLLRLASLVASPALLRRSALALLRDLLLVSPHRAAKLVTALHDDEREDAFVRLLTLNVVQADHDHAVVAAQCCFLLLSSSSAATQAEESFSRSFLERCWAPLFRAAMTPHAIANLLYLLRLFPNGDAKVALFSQTLSGLSAAVLEYLRIFAPSSQPASDAPPLPLSLATTISVGTHLWLPPLSCFPYLFSPDYLMRSIRDALPAAPPPPAIPAPSDLLSPKPALFRATPPEVSPTAAQPPCAPALSASEPLHFRWNVGLTSSFNASPAATDAAPLKYLDTQIAVTSQCYAQLPQNSKLSCIQVTTTCADQFTIGRIVIVGYPEAIHVKGIVLFESHYSFVHSHLVVPVSLPPELNVFRYLHLLYLPVHASRTNQILCLKLSLEGLTPLSPLSSLEQALESRHEALVAGYHAQLEPLRAFAARLHPADPSAADDTTLYNLYTQALNGLVPASHLPVVTTAHPLRDLFAVEYFLGCWLQDLLTSPASTSPRLPLSFFENLVHPLVLYTNARIATHFFSLVCLLHGHDSPYDTAKFFVNFLTRHFRSQYNPADLSWPQAALFQVIQNTLIEFDHPLLLLAIQECLVTEISTLIASPQTISLKDDGICSMLKLLLPLLTHTSVHYTSDPSSLSTSSSSSLSSSTSSSSFFSSSSSSSSSTTTTSSPNRNRSLPCTVCNLTQILDVRYRCGICPGLELCEACGPLPKFNHQDQGHPLLLVSSPHVRPRENSANPLFPPIALSCLYSTVDRCSNQCNSPPALRCINCPNYFLCRNCLGQLRSANLHPIEHSFVHLLPSMQTQFPVLVATTFAPLDLDFFPSHSSLEKSTEAGQFAVLQYAFERGPSCSNDLIDLALVVLQHTMTFHMVSHFTEHRHLLGWLLRFPDAAIQLRTIDLLKSFLNRYPDEAHRQSLAQLIFDELVRKDLVLSSSQITVYFDCLSICRPLQCVHFIPCLLDQLRQVDTLDLRWASIYADIFTLCSYSPDLSLLQGSALPDAILTVLLSTTSLPLYLLDSLTQLFSACLTSTVEIASTTLRVLATTFENHFASSAMALRHDQSMLFSSLFHLFISTLCHFHATTIPISFPEILSASFVRALFVFLASSCENDIQSRALPSPFLCDMISTILVLFSNFELKSIVLEHLIAFPLVQSLVFQKIFLWMAHHETLMHLLPPNILKKVHHWLQDCALSSPPIFALFVRTLLRLLVSHASISLSELLLELVSASETSARQFFIEFEGHQFIESLIFPASSSLHSPSRLVPSMLTEIHLMPPGLLNVASSFFTQPDSFYTPTPATMFIHQMTLGPLRWCLQLPREFIPTSITFYFVENWRHQNHFSTLPRELILTYSATPIAEAGPFRSTSYPIYHPAPSATKLGNRIIEVSFSITDVPLAHLPFLAIQLKESPSNLVVLSGLLIMGACGSHLAPQHAMPLVDAVTPSKPTFDRVQNKFHLMLARIWRTCIIFPSVATLYTSRENISTILSSLLSRNSEGKSIIQPATPSTEIVRLLEDCIFHLCKTSETWASATIHYLIQSEHPHVQLLSLLISLPAVSLMDSGLLQVQNQVFIKLVERIVLLDPVRTLTRALYYRFDRTAFGSTTTLPTDLESQLSVINTLVLVAFDILLAQRIAISQLSELLVDPKAYALLELISVYSQISGGLLFKELLSHSFFLEKFTLSYLENASQQDQLSLLATLEIFALLAGATESCTRVLCHETEFIKTLLALFSGICMQRVSALTPFLLHLTRICSYLTQSDLLRTMIGPYFIPVILPILLQPDILGNPTGPLYSAAMRFLQLVCNQHPKNQQLLTTLMLDLLHQTYTNSDAFWKFLAQVLSFQNWLTISFMGFPPNAIAKRLDSLPTRPLSLHHRPLPATEAPVSWAWSLPGNTIELKHHGQVLQPLLSHASSLTLRTNRPFVPKGIHSWEVRLHPLSPGPTHQVPIPAGFSFGVCPLQQSQRQRLGESIQIAAVGFMPGSGLVSYRGRTFTPFTAMSANDTPVWQVILDFTTDDLLIRHLQNQMQISMKSLMPDFSICNQRSSVNSTLYPAVTIPAGASCAYCFENYHWQTSDSPIGSHTKLSSCLYRADLESSIHRPDFTIVIPSLYAENVDPPSLAQELSEAIIPADSPCLFQALIDSSSPSSDLIHLEYQPISPHSVIPLHPSSSSSSQSTLRSDLNSTSASSFSCALDMNSSAATYLDASRLPYYPILHLANARDDTMGVLFEKLQQHFLETAPSLASPSHRVQYRLLSQLIACSKLQSFRSQFFSVQENQQLLFGLILSDISTLNLLSQANPALSANHQDLVLSESKSVYELSQPLLAAFKSVLSHTSTQPSMDLKLSMTSSLLQHKIIECLLTELAIVTGMRHRSNQHFVNEIDLKLIAGQSPSSSSSPSPPSTRTTSSGGTGYSNATTSYKTTWNVDQQHEVACIRDSHICLLLNLLNQIVELIAQVHGQMDAKLLSSILSVLDSSCLLPVIASYLRNGAIHEVLKSSGLYTSLLKLIESFSTIPTFQPLIQSAPSSESSLVALLHTLVELLKIFLDSAKRWDRGTPEESFGSSDITERGDYEFFLLCSSTLDLIESTQPTGVASSSELASLAADRSAASSTPATKSPQEMYEEILRPWQFMERSNISGVSCFQSVFSSDGRPGIAKCKRLVRELASLQTTLPLFLGSSIFLHVSDQRPDVMQALITGPADTPYSAGCFVFEIYTGMHYPSKPPSVQLLTTGAGTVRFNPNLYNSGYVCLSLLGTWRGTPQETWNPQTSTLLQVLVSIQSLIFIAEPYFNEPGYDSLKNSPSGQAESDAYNEHIRLATARWAIVEQLRIPSLGWKPVIFNHFKLRSAEVLKQVRQWRNMSKNKKPWNSILHDLKEQLNKIDQLAYISRES